MLKKIFKNTIWWIVLYIGLIIIFLFLMMMLFSFNLYKDIEWNHLINALNQKKDIILTLTFIGPLLGTSILCIFYYTIWKKKSYKATIKRANKSDYGNANFLVNEKVSNNLNTFEKYFFINSNQVGWVVKSRFNNQKTDFWISSCDKNGHHCLVIGATSSGKTQKTILQSIAYNAKINELNKKPSMVILIQKEKLQINIVVIYKLMVMKFYYLI